MLSRLKLDPFLVALATTVLLALAWPQPGVTGGVLHADKAASWGVALIFFLYGVSLAPRRLIESAARWELHLVVQAATFLLFPAVVLVVLALMGNLLPEALATGFFFLAALPSTVSSSVAMTSLARGNVPVAIFNASISSLIGVFATPMLMAWYLHSVGGGMDLGAVILKLVVLVVLPLAVGQAARPLLLKAVERHRGLVRVADRAVILAIVYNSFCDSVVAGVWKGQSVALLAEIVAAVLLLLAVVYALVQVACRLFGFSPADTTAVVFCASKKSLATGLPMAHVMFGAAPALSLIITPIMLYHFLQLVIIGVIAGRSATRADGLARLEAEESEPSLIAEDDEVMLPEPVAERARSRA
ncbi:bile acid:sodium symporter [Xanthobacter dioxanivorans]|uniref:Bile acid:sodium symporter n=1 Tax=Xanthobacter dioxanivorans TaxID=2528964 RepID=A0A974PL89_9HYPH|nr:bile acid:sodium symporter family protein [Xanthobacter dioxanivorans]QRG05683.1 bile acid:sodium symporter [Xanthobacter dioxanivorans]